MNNFSSSFIEIISGETFHFKQSSNFESSRWELLRKLFSRNLLLSLAETKAKRRRQKRREEKIASKIMIFLSTTNTLQKDGEEIGTDKVGHKFTAKELIKLFSFKKLFTVFIYV